MKRRGVLRLLSLVPVFGLGLPSLVRADNRPESRDLYVKAGHVFECENGHPVCQAIEDINFGDYPWHTKIGNFRSDMERPRHGGSWPRCPACKSKVVLWVKDGFVNGWEHP